MHGSDDAMYVLAPAISALLFDPSKQRSGQCGAVTNALLEAGEGSLSYVKRHNTSRGAPAGTMASRG